MAEGWVWRLVLFSARADSGTTALAIELANRYMQSAFCSWYSTGGSISGLLEPLTAQELNATGAVKGSTGKIFEKFAVNDVDAAGGGGEYTVQIGFGCALALPSGTETRELTLCVPQLVQRCHPAHCRRVWAVPRTAALPAHRHQRRCQRHVVDQCHFGGQAVEGFPHPARTVRSKGKAREARRACKCN